MEFKGTRGAEWVTQDEEHGLHTIWMEQTPDDLPVLVARTCYAIGSEANAKLIAAAPELLAFAIDFVEKVESGRAKSTDSYNKARAAINKALHP